MAMVSESIEVLAPVATAYNAWTQFESFPEFMGAVESVTQIDDATNHWIMSVGGVEREFDTRITEQVPDQVIAWTSVDGKSHTGRVTFEPVEVVDDAPDSLAPGRREATRVSVDFTWDDQTFLEKAGAAMGVDDMQVKKDLQRFKELVEEEGAAGGWRGEIHGGRSEGGPGTLGNPGVVG